MFRHFCLLCGCLRVSWVQGHPWWDWNPTSLPVTLTVLASLDPLGTRGIPLGFLLTQKEALHCICKRICRRPGYSEISHMTVYGQATEWSGNSQRNEIAMVWLHAGTWIQVTDTYTRHFLSPTMNLHGKSWKGISQGCSTLYIQPCYYQQKLHFVDSECRSLWVVCRQITPQDPNETHQRISHRLQNNSCKHHYQAELKTNAQGKQWDCKHFPCPWASWIYLFGIHLEN